VGYPRGLVPGGRGNSPRPAGSGQLGLVADRHERRRDDREEGGEPEGGGVPPAGDDEAGDRRDGRGREELRGVLHPQRTTGPERPGPLGDRGERQAVVGDGHQGRDDHDQDRDAEVERGGQAEQGHARRGGQLVVDGVTSSQWGKRFPGRSVAWERGSVAGVNLGGGQLVIDAIVGKAKVIRKSKGGLVTSTAGTTVGSITVNGEPQELPIDQPIEIPGLAKIEPKVVTKVAGGIKVVALRITLLDGTGAVIDLGVAKASIRTR